MTVNPNNEKFLVYTDAKIQWNKQSASPDSGKRTSKTQAVPAEFCKSLVIKISRSWKKRVLATGQVASKGRALLP